MSWKVVDILNGVEQLHGMPIPDNKIIGVLMNHLTLPSLPKLGGWTVVEASPGHLVLERKMDYVKSYRRQFDYVADATGKGS